jgi:hypothetical protein
MSYISDNEESKHSQNREKGKDSESREEKGFGEQSSAEELVMGGSGGTRL